MSNNNVQITPHFNLREFECKCGCGAVGIKSGLPEKLEKVYQYLAATKDSVTAIYITSGYRCPRHSCAVGGTADDAHTRGLAADFYAVKGDGKTRWSSNELAAVCELIGFTGIGIIDNTAVHADIRTSENYKNSHWFGDERTGNDNISSFMDYLPRSGEKPITTTKHKIAVYIDGEKVFESEV